MPAERIIQPAVTCTVGLDGCPCTLRVSKAGNGGKRPNKNKILIQPGWVEARSPSARFNGVIVDFG